MYSFKENNFYLFILLKAFVLNYTSHISTVYIIKLDMNSE